VIENEWGARFIKPRWHNVEIGWVARKVQDVTNPGAPDVDACWNGNVWKVELKYRPKAPARPDTLLTFSRYSKDEPNRQTMLTREQVRNLDEWIKASGNGGVMIGVDKEWFFFDASVVIANNDGMTIDQLRSWAELRGQDIKHCEVIPQHLEPQSPEME